MEIAETTAALVVTTAGGGGPALVVMFGAGVIVWIGLSDTSFFFLAQRHSFYLRS